MEKEPSNLHVTWKHLQRKFEEELNTIEKEEADVRSLSRRAMALCASYLRQASATITDQQLSEEQEVHFFKKVKPSFSGRLMYYRNLSKIESERPPADPAGIERYYTERLVSLAKIYAEHQFIHEYMQSGATYLDQHLFFRQQDNAVIAMNGLLPPADGAYQMSYDAVIAQLLAAELMQIYLVNYLTHLYIPGRSVGPPPKITWTGRTVHLVEMAYGLYAAGVCNNGKASLKDIMDTLEAAFNIRSGNYSRMFQEILYRQSGPTVFHDLAKNALVRYIDRLEDKHVG